MNERLVGEDKSFDYGVFFDEEGSGVAGKSRWGKIPPVVLADSKEGKKLIAVGMKATKDEFMRCIKEVRQSINYYSDEELFEEKILDTKKKILNALDDKKPDNFSISMFKYYCSCLGQYVGTNIWLYDNDGEGIRNNKHLKDVLNKWGTDEYKNLKVFVLPIDVHS